MNDDAPAFEKWRMPDGPVPVEYRPPPPSEEDAKALRDHGPPVLDFVLGARHFEAILRGEGEP